MKNLLVLLSVAVFSCSAMAEVLDIGQNIGKSAAEIQAEKRERDEENNQRGTSIVDDLKDFFSSMNFSFGGKTEEELVVNSAKKSEEETQESYEERLQKKAEDGDLQIQKALAYMYLYGRNGVKSDYEKAFKYYAMAAAQNDPIAINNLGSLYFNGIGVPVNYQKAIVLFEKAAEAGNSEAALNLGFIYLSGRNGSSNAPHAVALFKQAAEEGNIIAKYMLGYAYLRGFSVAQDYNTAAALIKEVADADFDEAQYVIGTMYLQGTGIAKNYGNADKYLMWASKQGNLDAIMLLADLYVEGRSLPKNPYNAYIMYNAASVMGEKQAAGKRDAVESMLKLEEIIPAQAAAENFRPNPSELTNYARHTFGYNIRRYIDENLKKK